MEGGERGRRVSSGFREGLEARTNSPLVELRYKCGLSKHEADMQRFQRESCRIQEKRWTRLYDWRTGRGGRAIRDGR